MLGSLALIPPHGAHTLWSPVTPRSASPPSPTTHASQQHQSRRNNAAPNRNPTLAALDLEEEALIARKATVRRFGATWLRPPGVSKTYQAMVDEAAERAEQEAQRVRDLAMAEQQAAAEEEARRTGALHGMAEGSDAVEGMERDLDGSVPEAEDMGGSEDEGMEDITGEGVGGERDLDEDVPEAGSYEHTDTEVEDESSEDDDSLRGTHAQMAEEHITPERTHANLSPEGARGPTVIQNFRMPIPPPQRSTMSSEYGEQDSSMVMSSPITRRPPRAVPGQQSLREAPRGGQRAGRGFRSNRDERLTENRPGGA